MKIEEYGKKKIRNIIGLMSGTSVDGIDAALVEVKGSFLTTKVKLIKYICVPFKPDTRKKIFKMFDYNKTSLAEASNFNFELGKIFADAAAKAAKSAGYLLKDIDLIASHGQTIYHNPPYSTLQIGEGSVIAQRTGCLTVSDFRCADMAQGGQGAPLVPYFDYIFFAHKKLSRIILNIGGIANLTFIKKSSRIDDVTAFDTGPGNMAVDSLVKIYTNGRLNYDKDGQFAFKGKIDYNLLARLLDNKYLKAKPPKSTGREEFGRYFVNLIMKENRPLNPLTLITTMSAFTIEAVIYGINNFIKKPVDEIIISGGGSRNKFFVEYLKSRGTGPRAPTYKVYTSDDFGLNGDAKEAIAFAVLGNEAILGHFNNVPRVTGAKKKVIMGSISQGSGITKL